MNRQDCPDYTNVTVVIFREQTEPFVPNTLFPAPQGPEKPSLGPQYQGLRGFAPGPHSKFGNQVPAARGSSFTPQELARAPLNPPPERPPPGRFPVFSPILEVNAPGPVIGQPNQAGTGEETASVLEAESEQLPSTETKAKPEFAKVQFRSRPEVRPAPQFAFQDDVMAQAQPMPPSTTTGAQPRPQSFVFAGQPPADPLPPAPLAPVPTDEWNPELGLSQLPPPLRPHPPAAGPRIPSPPGTNGSPATAIGGRPADQRASPQQNSFSATNEQLARVTTTEDPVSAEESQATSGIRQTQRTATTQASPTLWKLSSSGGGWKSHPGSSRESHDQADRREDSGPNPDSHPAPTPRRSSRPPPHRQPLLQDEIERIRQAPEANLYAAANINIGRGRIPNLQESRFVGFSRPGFESNRKRLRRRSVRN